MGERRVSVRKCQITLNRSGVQLYVQSTEKYSTMHATYRCEIPGKTRTHQSERGVTLRLLASGLARRVLHTAGLF